MSKKEEDFMLTTFDNPFNPFTDFEAWWKHDLQFGHDTNGLLAKTALVTTVNSDSLNDSDIISAADEIVSRWPLIYRKVTKGDFVRTRTG